MDCGPRWCPSAAGAVGECKGDLGAVSVVNVVTANEKGFGTVIQRLSNRDVDAESW